MLACSIMSILCKHIDTNNARILLAIYIHNQNIQIAFINIIGLLKRAPEINIRYL